MSLEIISFNSKDYKHLNEFYRFPLSLYRNDPNFIYPMKMDLMGNKILGTHGLFTSHHPFHNHADVQYMIAKKGNDIVGRISCSINHTYNDHHKKKSGAFGFFEVTEDYDVAKALLDKGVNWITSKGMNEILGPQNFSSNESWGLLIEGYEHLPFMETPYNKVYYKEFLEKYGFQKAKDMIAQIMPVKMSETTTKRHDRLTRIVDRIKREREITIRPINLKKGFMDDIEIMRTIYNDAWKDNWGFVPINKEEMDHAAQNLKIVADQGLIQFAYVKDEPAGFIGSIPDVNEMIGPSYGFMGHSDYFRIIKILLKRRKVKRVRLMLLGILEKYKKIGMDAVLYYESFNNAHTKHYENCEISWLLEDNVLVIRAGESMGGKKYKTWRIYSLNI